MVGIVGIGSNPIVALGIAGILFAVSRPIIRRISNAERNPWLAKVLTFSLILHLLAAPLQIWVVDHLYGGIADWNQYLNRGAALARSGFNLNYAHVPGIVGDGFVSIFTGVVFRIIGFNQLGAFLIFSWFAFLGLIFFYRAFSLTFTGANTRRYAILLFFLPSLIFWTADVSKEAIMSLSLGLCAYGAAKILARRRGGFALLFLGGAIGAPVRANELLLVMAGFAVAMLILPAGPRRNLGGLRRLGSILVLGALLAGSLFITLHYLVHQGGSLSLNSLAKGNQGASTPGAVSSAVTYSSNPAAYPKDLYVVLFDPLIIKAHGSGQRLAAIENLIIIGVILSSMRQLRIVIRAAFAKPYVMLCAIYSAAFCYAFAALGNLGLITRERTLLFPFLLVILCIPRSPKGEPPQFEWELRRRARLERRRKGEWSETPTRTAGSPVRVKTRAVYVPSRRRVPVATSSAGRAKPEAAAGAAEAPTANPPPPPLG
jgi:hypothetical protein